MQQEYTLEEVIMGFLCDGRYHSMEALADEMKIEAGGRVAFGWILRNMYDYGMLVIHPKEASIRIRLNEDDTVPFDVRKERFFIN